MFTVLDPNKVWDKAYIGNSTNTKPTPSTNPELHNGDRCWEMDTGDVYFWDEENEQWVNPFAE